MEVGPFRTIPGSQTESGTVELRLVEGGWEEYATVIFGMFMFLLRLTCASNNSRPAAWYWVVLRPFKRALARAGSSQ